GRCWQEVVAARGDDADTRKPARRSRRAVMRGPPAARYCRSMSTWRLDSVFAPASVAVVGGSPRERSAGRAVMRNLAASGYAGRIGWVTPRHREIDGIATVRRLRELGWVPDLAIITAPPAVVPE